MFDSALNHLPFAIAFIVILIAHFLHLDVRLSPAPRQRTPTPRRSRTHFGNREVNGEMVLVDPDGRISRSRRR